MLRADFDGNHEECLIFDRRHLLAFEKSFPTVCCTSQESNLVTDSTLANTSASVRAHPYTPPMTRTVLPNISSLPFHHELLDLSSRPHKLTPMQRIPPPAAILPPCATAASSLFWQPRGTTAAGRIELRAHWCVDMRAAGAEAGLGIQLATAEPLHAANSTQGQPWSVIVSVYSSLITLRPV